MIPDVSFPFKYAGPGRDTERGIDMIITVSAFNVDDDYNVDIEEFFVSIDYEMDDNHHHPFDDTFQFIQSMLDEHEKLQGKILDAMHPELKDELDEKLIDAWDDYWTEQGRDHGFTFDEDNMI